MLHGPHFTDGTAWFPLHVAIHSELMDAVMSAVQESRVHERLPEHSGGVPLHLAASTGHTALLRLLLDSHADVNASDDFEDEPLHAAAWAGSVDICQLLLQHGAAVNAPGHADETPLEIAILRGHLSFPRVCMTRSRLVQQAISIEARRKSVVVYTDF